MDQTPASLLERLRDPVDSDSWDRFVELYTPLIYYWTNQVGMSLHDADDLVQDVFAVLVAKLPTFSYDAKRSFRSWLRTVLLNEWRRKFRNSDPLAKGAAALPDIAEPDGVAEFWDSEYRNLLVRRALELIRDQFQPSTWTAFWKTVVEECSGKEVAAELGLSVNAVYIAKSRVLTSLRREIEGLLE